MALTLHDLISIAWEWVKTFLRLFFSNVIALRAFLLTFGVVSFSTAAFVLFWVIHASIIPDDFVLPLHFQYPTHQQVVGRNTQYGSSGELHGSGPSGSSHFRGTPETCTVFGILDQEEKYLQSRRKCKDLRKQEAKDTHENFRSQSVGDSHFGEANFAAKQEQSTNDPITGFPAVDEYLWFVRERSEWVFEAVERGWELLVDQQHNESWFQQHSNPFGGKATHRDTLDKFETLCDEDSMEITTASGRQANAKPKTSSQRPRSPRDRFKLPEENADAEGSLHGDHGSENLSEETLHYEDIKGLGSYWDRVAAQRENIDDLYFEHRRNGVFETSLGTFVRLQKTSKRQPFSLNLKMRAPYHEVNRQVGPVMLTLDAIVKKTRNRHESQILDKTKKDGFSIKQQSTGFAPQQNPNQPSATDIPTKLVHTTTPIAGSSVAYDKALYRSERLISRPLVLEPPTTAFDHRRRHWLTVLAAEFVFFWPRLFGYFSDNELNIEVNLADYITLGSLAGDEFLFLCMHPALQVYNSVVVLEPILPWPKKMLKRHPYFCCTLAMLLSFLCVSFFAVIFSLNQLLTSNDQEFADELDEDENDGENSRTDDPSDRSDRDGDGDRRTPEDDERRSRGPAPDPTRQSGRQSGQERTSQFTPTRGGSNRYTGGLNMDEHHDRLSPLGMGIHDSELHSQYSSRAQSREASSRRAESRDARLGSRQGSLVRDCSVDRPAFLSGSGQRGSRPASYHRSGSYARQDSNGRHPSYTRTDSDSRRPSFLQEMDDSRRRRDYTRPMEGRAMDGRQSCLFHPMSQPDAVRQGSYERRRMRERRSMDGRPIDVATRSEIPSSRGTMPERRNSYLDKRIERPVSHLYSSSESSDHGSGKNVSGTNGSRMRSQPVDDRSRTVDGRRVNESIRVNERRSSPSTDARHATSLNPKATVSIDEELRTPMDGHVPTDLKRTASKTEYEDNLVRTTSKIAASGEGEVKERF